MVRSVTVVRRVPRVRRVTVMKRLPMVNRVPGVGVSLV